MARLGVARADEAGAHYNPSDVVGFWRDAGPERWFAKDAAFDQQFRERCIDAHWVAAQRDLDRWLETPDGALALILLTDQFPRNAFRGTAHMYAADSLARHFAHQAQRQGHMSAVKPALRLFFVLPFAHSEDGADQVVAALVEEGLVADGAGGDAAGARRSAAGRCRRSRPGRHISRRPASERPRMRSSAAISGAK